MINDVDATLPRYDVRVAPARWRRRAKMKAVRPSAETAEAVPPPAMSKMIGTGHVEDDASAAAEAARTRAAISSSSGVIVAYGLQRTWRESKCIHRAEQLTGLALTSARDAGIPVQAYAGSPYEEGRQVGEHEAESELAPPSTGPGEVELDAHVLHLDLRKREADRPTWHQSSPSESGAAAKGGR